MNQLIRLKNGNWIDPSTITEIRVAESSMNWGPRVVVVSATENQVIMLKTMRSARMYADKLAKQSNFRIES